MSGIARIRLTDTDEDDDDDDEPTVADAGSDESASEWATDSEDDDDDDVTAAAAASAIVRPSLAGGNRWMLADGYRMEMFEQMPGQWPIGHPLPLPKWSSTTKPILVVDKIWQYEDLSARVEVLLHRLLEETHYDTVNNFIEFHGAYRSDCSAGRRSVSAADSLQRFYQAYRPPINRRHHMCVSLAMEVVGRLADELPELAAHFYVVSCEEAVEGSRPYVQHCAAMGMDRVESQLEKEHALLAMRVRVAGRDGLMLLDPGYHVARAVTVMRDGCYPHSGWFTQSLEAHCKREYAYRLCADGDFVEWSERTTRAGVETQEVSMVYVGRPYRTAVDVTVRRNLVYNFRSLLSRDAKGRVCAGLYFPVSSAGADGQLTLFYDSPAGDQQPSVKIKQTFGAFGTDPAAWDAGLQRHVDQLAVQLRMPGDQLIELLRSLHNVMTDVSFVKQLLTINDRIVLMSADN